MWQAGSEHNRQVYRASDYGLIRSWVSHPYGDGQALAELNGIVYTGSHANGNTNLYQDAYRWPGLDGATSSKPIRWMGAFSTVNPEHLTWYPSIGSQYGEGSWELFADSTDCLWTGGDFNRGSYDGNVPRYVRGFAKFCAADTTPPAPPTSPSATARDGGIDLAWEASTGDDRGGEVRYEILKNDSVFASYISDHDLPRRHGHARRSLLRPCVRHHRQPVGDHAGVHRRRQRHHSVRARRRTWRP